MRMPLKPGASLAGKLSSEASSTLSCGANVRALAVPRTLSLDRFFIEPSGSENCTARSVAHTGRMFLRGVQWIHRPCECDSQ